MMLSSSELDAFIFNCLYSSTGLKKKAKSSILSQLQHIRGISGAMT